MTKIYENEARAVMDSYRTKAEEYWKKSMDDRQTLSSDEVSALEMMKKDLLKRNGTGDELVDKIKGILYLNAVREEYKKEDELYQKYLLLSKRYHTACEKGDLNKEDEAKLVKQINDLASVFSEH